MKTFVKIIFYTIIVLQVIVSCNPKSNDAIEFYIDKIDINQYDNDSLNKIRPYVVPIMYFHIRAINNSPHSELITVNTFGENEEDNKLFVLFNYNAKNDTVVITNFQSFKSFEILSYDTTKFMVNAYMPPFYEKYESKLSVQDLMTLIANDGVMFYKKISDDLSTHFIEFKKSENFYIEYRDPNVISID